MNGTTSRIAAIGLAFIMAMGALVFVPSDAEAMTTPTWTEASPLIGNFSEAAYCQIGDTVYIFGGSPAGNHFTETNQSLAYILKTGAGQKLAPMPVGVRGASAVAFEGKVYVFGGYNLSLSAFVDLVQIYDPAKNTWSNGHNMSIGVWQGKSVLKADEHKIFVIGGRNSSTPISNVQIYNPRTDSWTAGEPYPIPIESGVATTDNQGHVCYFGGYTTFIGATASSYHFNGNSWSSLPNMPMKTTYASSVVGPDGFVYVFGGGQSYALMGPPMSTVQMFDISSYTWSLGPELPGTSELSAAAMTDDGTIYLLGGDNATNNQVQDVWTLNVMNNTVTVMTSDVLSGQTLTAKVTMDYAFRSNVSFSGMAALNHDGVSYGSSMFSSHDNVGYVLISVSGSAPSGTYQLLLTDIQASSSMDSFLVPDMSVTVTVTNVPSLDQQVTDLMAEVVSLTQQVDSAKAQLNDLSGNISADQASLAAMQSTISALQAQLLHADQLLAALGSSLGSQADDLSANQNLSAAQVALLKAQVDALNAQLNESRTQLSTLQTGQDKLLSSVDGRADGTLAMITLVMVIIGIALMAVVLVLLVRKK